MTDDNRVEDESKPVEDQFDPDEVLRGLSSESCQTHDEGNIDARQEQEASENVGAKNEQQLDYEQQLANERLTSGDIRFVIATMKKEAEYDEISIKQLFYGYCSAFTKCPIPHTKLSIIIWANCSHPKSLAFRQMHVDKNLDT